MARYSMEDWTKQKSTVKPKKKSKSKYNNTRTIVDNKHFDSIAEAMYYTDLKLRILAGDVLYFHRQVPFDLPGNTKYRVDFQVFLTDGTVEYIDVKGFETAMFKMKKKQVEDLYPIKIICVKKVRRR